MKTAVICFPGLTLVEYDDEIIPAHWIRIAVNSAIRVVQDTATVWLISDERVLADYRRIPAETVQWWATKKTKDAAARKGSVSDVTDEISPPLAALEVAKRLNAERIFTFGLDCYRKRHDYYFDGGRPRDASERRVKSSTRARDAGRGLADQVYVTDALKDAIRHLNIAKDRHSLWGLECWCVGSPRTKQTAIPQMDIEDFYQLLADESIPIDELDREPLTAPEEPTVPEAPAPRKRRGRPPKAAQEPTEEIQAEAGNV